MALAGEPRPLIDVAAYGRRACERPRLHRSRRPLAVGSRRIHFGPTRRTGHAVDRRPRPRRGPRGGGDDVDRPRPVEHPIQAGNRATNVARLLQSLGTDPDLVARYHRHAMRTGLPRAAFAGTIDFDLAPDEFGEDPSVRALLETLGVELRARDDGAQPPPAQRVRHHQARRRPDTDHATGRTCSPTSSSLSTATPARHGDADRSVRARVRVRSPRHREGAATVGAPRTRGSSTTRRGSAWRTVRREPHVGRRVLVGATRATPWYTSTPAGTDGTPGPLGLFSQQEALDYYDAIEWVAAQEWCTGAVGLVAASYGATIQWTVARLRPPSLRAIIPWAGDVDSYRELAYPGGILHEGYHEWWWRSVTPNVTPGESPPDFVQAAPRAPALRRRASTVPTARVRLTAALDGDRRSRSSPRSARTRRSTPAAVRGIP